MGRKNLGCIILFLIILFLICGTITNLLTDHMFLSWRDM